MVRVGIGFGLLPMWSSRQDLVAALDAIEGSGFDSVWLSDHVSSGTPDPLTTLAFAAAKTERLKLGLSVLVMPGRRPLVNSGPPRRRHWTPLRTSGNLSHRGAALPSRCFT